MKTKILHYKKLQPVESGIGEKITAITLTAILAAVVIASIVLIIINF
jgi:hypothetical protein